MRRNSWELGVIIKNFILFKIMNIWRKIYKKYFGKNIFDMEPEQVARNICLEASKIAVATNSNNYFRKISKYYSQTKADKGMYFNELTASFLVMFKLLTEDYCSKNNNDHIAYIAQKIYSSFENYLSEIGLDKDRVKEWGNYLLIKEKNIIQAKNGLKAEAIKENYPSLPQLINKPENFIIIGSAYDTSMFFSNPKRGGKNNEQLHSFIMKKHTEGFLVLRDMLK